MMIRSLVALVVAIVVGLGCKQDGAGQDKQIPSELKPRPVAVDVATLQAPPLFAHIPADTPYVVAAFEPVSLDYYAKLKNAFGPAFAQFLATRQRDHAPDGDRASDPGGKLVDAILDELGGKLDAKGFESLGLSATPRFALYGIGLAPIVARIEIKDEKVLMATIERVAAQAGIALPPQQTHGGKSFWRHTDDDTTGLLGIIDGHLVAAFGPADSFDNKLDQIVGVQKPQASMADGKLLAEVMTRHGFGPNLIGFVDTRKVAAAAVALSDKQLPQVCVAELDRIAARVPRIVIGYAEITAKRASGGAVLELEQGLLAEVSGMRTEVPGLGAALADKPLMAFGGGFDLAKGQALLVKTFGALGKIGDLCHAPKLVGTAADGLDDLDKPLPEPVRKITGVVAAVHAFEMKGSKPVKLDLFMMVTSTAAKELYDLAKGILPEDPAKYGLLADGKLHELKIPGGIIPFAVFGGVGDKAFVGAIGDKGKALAERGLHGTANGKAPFFVATYDYGRLMELQTSFADLAGDDDPELKAVRDMQLAIAKMFDRATMSVDVNDKGIVMWGAIDMK